MRRILALSFAATVASACFDTMPTPPTGVAPIDKQLANSFANGPDEAGPFVARFVDDFFLLFMTDPTTGLAALIRLPDPPGDVEPCGGSQTLDLADLQLVFHTNGSINMVMIGQQVSARVYELGPFIAALRAGGACNAIRTQTPIAEGLVDFVSRDNDAFFSGTRVNAFGWTVQGSVVRSADNADLTFRAVLAGAVNPDGALLGLVSRITLSP